MKKITKNILLGMGVLTSVSTPIIAVVACGEREPFDDEGEQVRADNKRISDSMALIFPESQTPIITNDDFWKAEGQYHKVMELTKWKFQNTTGKWLYYPKDFRMKQTTIISSMGFAQSYLPDNFKLDDDVEEIQSGAFQDAYLDNANPHFIELGAKIAFPYSIGERGAFDGADLPEGFSIPRTLLGTDDEINHAFGGVNIKTDNITAHYLFRWYGSDFESVKVERGSSFHKVGLTKAEVYKLETGKDMPATP